MTHKNDLTEGKIASKLFKFLLPILGSSLIQQLYNTVDVYFAGNFIAGSNAMAAVGASGMIVTLLVGFFNGMSVGSGVVVSKYFGRHDDNMLSCAVHSTVGFAIIGGVLLGILGFIISPYILICMNTPDEILDMASVYIRIYFVSVPALVFYNLGTGVLRATGDSKRPLFFQCIGGILNVIMDYLFIVVLGMGVNGVAYATMFSQYIPAILVFVYLLKTNDKTKISVKQICIHKDILISVIKIGIPAGIQSMVITLSNVVVQSQINNFGTDTIAAFTAYFKVELIMYLPILAFGQAITTFVGQNFGAKKYDRIEKGVRCCLIMGVITSMITSGFVLMFARNCFAFFNSNPEVIKIGMQFIYINASLYFIYNFLEVFSGAIRGMGNATVPMIIIMFNMCVVRLFVLFFMVKTYHTVVAVAVCYPITWLCTSVCLGVYYLIFKKKIRYRREKCF